jgi:hypothetical protein
VKVWLLMARTCFPEMGARITPLRNCGRLAAMPCHGNAPPPWLVPQMAPALRGSRGPRTFTCPLAFAPPPAYRPAPLSVAQRAGVGTGRDVAQPGSASHWGCGGRRFESSRPDQLCINSRALKAPQLSEPSSQGRCGAFSFSPCDFAKSVERVKTLAQRRINPSRHMRQS